MKKLTPISALRLSVKQWSGLPATTREKEQARERITPERVTHNCFLCEYVKQRSMKPEEPFDNQKHLQCQRYCPVDFWTEEPDFRFHPRGYMCEWPYSPYLNWHYQQTKSWAREVLLLMKQNLEYWLALREMNEQ